MKLLVVNGPNLNMLGIREPQIYGKNTYAGLVSFIEEVCAREEIEVEVMQSNHEGVIVDAIQAAYQKKDGIVINPAAYTHTSVAILDALKDREEFRHISYPGMACVKTFCGYGFAGYEMAILYLKDLLSGVIAEP